MVLAIQFNSKEPYVIAMSGLVKRDHKLSYSSSVGYITTVIALSFIQGRITKN